MQGITNATITSGGGIKILNVVQTGTLTRDGAVFSGFSSNTNYLQLGARVDKGILSLDSSTYYKSFETVTPTTNTWEFVTKIHHIASSTQRQYILNQYVLYGSELEILTSGVIRLQISNSSSSADIGVQDGTTVLADDTDYWIKIEFTGSAYKAYLSTDGQTWAEECSITSDTKISNRGPWVIGVATGTDRYFLGSIDIAETYIKINGDFWWKGVETLTL
jgi:hypothetical protein